MLTPFLMSLRTSDLRLEVLGIQRRKLRSELSVWYYPRCRNANRQNQRVERADWPPACMIKNLALRFGKAPSLAPETFACTPITVFVGPNNSGKSKVLQELHRFCTSGQESQTDVILDRLEIEGLPPLVAEQRMAEMTLKPGPNETVHPDHLIVGRIRSRFQVQRQHLLHTLIDPKSNLPGFCQWFLGANTMILDGKSRIGLVQGQRAGDLQEVPQSSFQVLFQDETRRAELRRIIYEAFKLYLVIDPTLMGHLRLRLSSVAPPSPMTERGFHEEAVSFHSAAQLIDTASDGIKAFTGMMTEIVAGNPDVLLIDEPEAFLHPALSLLLGQEISRATAKAGKRLFASTHSPNFVMGCVQSGVPITLVRLTYRGGVATARRLASEDILKLMRNPLLRSANVLAGLFYESVVVTEADADRAFYQEVNERLLHDHPDQGIRNCLFLNAQNKQTVPTIMQPLRHLGIATAGIVDIDIVKDGGAAWSAVVNGASLPELEQHATATLRAAANRKFIETGKDMKREGGISLLNAEDREAVENFFRRLAEYGLFVVPNGELESWLKHLGATGHGPAWLIAMFEKMGEDPASPSYERPDTGDVWEFVRSIRKWCADPNRRGIPV